VRDSGLLFLVKPGHEDLNLEQVLERESDYVIVKTFRPTARRIAKKTDPRGG
jgi:hypothetical protein